MEIARRSNYRVTFATLVIGIGAGDPEHVTVQAIRALNEADVFFVIEKGHETDELVRLRLAIYQQPGFERAMENIVAVQDWKYREPYVWSPSWCGQISAPTLLLWTDNDPTGGLDEADLLEQWIPDSRLEVIEGAGHLVHEERPGRVADLVERHARAIGILAP